MTKEVRVEIYGEVYGVRGDLDPAYVNRLARIVGAKMRALADQTETPDTRRLAVLAALNLADELQQLEERFRRERFSFPREFAARLEQCSRQLEAALGSRPPS